QPCRGSRRRQARHRHRRSGRSARRGGGPTGMKVAVVGAGPGGALLAWHLARDGASVTLFDASHPREKPCGGGVTARALDLLPPAPPDDPLPVRLVETCRFESGMGEGVEVPLTRPVAVAARRELDAWLLRRAVAA